MATIDSFSSSSPRGLVKALIIPLKPNNEVPRGRADQDVIQLGKFFINPESWSDNKSATWVKHNVPGLSDPIQQWTTSGPRQVTFQALITKDISDITKFSKLAVTCDSQGNSNIIKRVASIALQNAGISEDEIIDSQQEKLDTLDLDITDKLNFYRSLVYPNIFGQGGKVMPPNPVLLVVGTTFGHRGKLTSWVVDKVEIKITKQFSNLLPTEAVVTFTMTELVDKVLSSDTNILTDT